jgi:hypothetical protein
MNLTVVKKAILELPPEEQDELAGHLAALRQLRSSGHDEELSRRLADQDPDNWLSLDELRDKLESDG